jgi:dTDP-4-amino-4,6-dideoxygalactose transaminase
LFRNAAARTAAFASLHASGIDAVFHYVPLHSSPAGRRVGRASGRLGVTDDIAERLARLPLWIGMTDADLDLVVEAVRQAAGAVSG